MYQNTVVICIMICIKTQ